MPASADNSANDVRRPNNIHRYKSPAIDPVVADSYFEYTNLLGMMLSMLGLMMKMKWAAWVAVYCSFFAFSRSRTSEDTKQLLSSFMLSVSAVVMSYMQNPQPLELPF